MRNCKQTFTSDIRKCGYLKVGRNLLKSLYSGDMEQRQLAQILLCVQTFAYFSEGQVCTSDGTYLCRPGEWITSYSEICVLTQIHRHQIRARMKQLEHMHLLSVEHLKLFKRITLANAEQEMQPLRTSVSTSPAASATEARNCDSLFASAGHFYAPVSEQKGGTIR